jgi:hypothetical protein
MIGTWNVAGRVPSDDLRLDEWLCTQEPADLYVLGYVPPQNMKPLVQDILFKWLHLCSVSRKLSH